MSVRPNARTSRPVALSTVLLAFLYVVVPALPALAEDPLSVSVSASPSPVASGQQLTHTIVVTNTGDQDTLTDARVVDQVNGMTGIGGASGYILSSSAGTCSQSADLVTCDAPNLAGGQVWTITIRGVVTAANGTTLTNTATASARKPGVVFTVTDTTSTLVTGAPQGPLPDLTLGINGSTSADPLSAQTYVLTVNNQGSKDAQDVRVVNTVPTGWAITSALGTSLFECTFVAPTVTCDGGRVNAGSNATITIEVTVAAGAPATYTDTAVVDPFDSILESNELNNTASLTTNVPGEPVVPGALDITKTDSPDPLRPGDELTYTSTITNTSASRAERIVVTDGTIGLGRASIEAVISHPYGGCTVNESEVVCVGTRGTEMRLNPGDSMVLTITGIVEATPGSVMHNTATVTGKIGKTTPRDTATATTTVRPGVDLTAAQYAVCDPCPFRARAPFDYRIVVGNSGLDDATNVVVREPLPGGIVFDGFTSTGGWICSETDDVVTCEGGLVEGVNTSGSPHGTTEEIILDLIGPPHPASLDGTVTVDPGNAIFEHDETNNTDTTTTVFETGIDLTVMKTVNHDPVAPDGTLVYTITVTNIGTEDATGVALKDVLPQGTRFRDAHDDDLHNFTCEHPGAPPEGEVVVCLGGEIDGTFSTGILGPPHVYGPPDFAVIQITLFAPSPPGFISNQVRVDQDNTIPEISESNNINRLVSDVQIGGGGVFNELHASLTDDPDPVAPSGTLVYTLVVENTGSDPAFNLKVRDILPTGFEFRSADDTAPGVGAFICSHSDQIVDCSGGRLNSMESRTILIKVFASETPGSYDNQAIIDPFNEIPEENETNNTATVTTTVMIGGGGGFNELVITSLTDAPDPVAPEGIITYVLNVANTGTDIAFDVAVRNTLPDEVDFVEASGTGGMLCTPSGQVVDCHGFDIAGGGSETITIKGRAPAQHNVTLINEALVDPNDTIDEADETNNAASTTTEVLSQIDLQTTNVGGACSGQSGNNAGCDWLFTVSNTGGGPDEAEDVAVETSLPIGVIPLNASIDGSPAGWSCQVEENPINKVTCTGASLAGGGSVTFRVRVYVTADSGQEITSSTVADQANTIVEIVENNNTSQSTTTA